MDGRQSASGKISPKSGSVSGSSNASLEIEEDAQLNRNYDFESPGFALEDDAESDFSDTEPADGVPEQAFENPDKNDQLMINDGDAKPETEFVQEESDHEEDIDEENDVKENTERGGGEQAAPNEMRSTEDEGEDVDGPAKGGKKTARKPKRKVEKRTAFDGRDVVFVTECTQTDWKWRDKIEKSGRGRVLTPRTVKPESREAVSRTHTEGESTMDTRTATDITPFSLQPNDEFGIPLLDMSSDSDSSDEDAPKKSRTHRHHLPTIGPPQILKYVRESERMEKDTDRTSSEIDDDHMFLESADYSGGRSPGMFSGPCEFCGNDIKPFPSLDQQLSVPPESLYCCEDYREFVEFAMSTASKLEEDVAKKNERISIKVHPHHGSKQARKMAKEQAVQRMREREMQRRQQEATGMQAAYFNSGNVNQAGMVSRAGKNAGGGAMLFKDMGNGRSNEIALKPSLRLFGVRPQTKIGKRFAQNTNNIDSTSHGSRNVTTKSGEVVAPDATRKKKTGEGGGGKRGDTEKKGGEGGKQTSAGDVAAGSGVGGSGGAVPTGAYGVPGMPYGPGVSMSGFLGPEVARQMKTINYQLSSQRCLEEGWTLRAPSPLDMDDMDAEVFVPEPLHPSMIASGKLYDRKLIEKFYPDGSKFLTVFPDGTGNVFYPSGNVAILILSIALGQYTYIVYDDGDEPELLAVFGPNGVGCCHFANGKIRLNYDQMEGLELDVFGGKKRLWSWKDQETHVHAPPFQPIVFGMNRFIGVRFMAQDSIALTLTGRKRSCRFNVGVKLKLVCPENLQPKVIDENQLFIDERKVRVDAILDKVSTLLKFPKSPKVDRILPPLSIKSRQQKVEKMKQDYISSQSQNSGKKSKKVVKQARLSPLPVISVN